MIGFHYLQHQAKREFLQQSKRAKNKNKTQTAILRRFHGSTGCLAWLPDVVTQLFHMSETFKMAAVEDEVEKDGEDVTFKSLVIRGYNTHF